MEFDGTVTIAERPEDSHVEVEMQTASITTDTGMRDDHLRSDDFLEVDEYPTMTFRSKELRPTGENTFQLVGDLTIKGITRDWGLLVAEELGWEDRGTGKVWTLQSDSNSFDFFRGLVRRKV